ncbi:MICAL-like protein 1 [Aulostomus maculatus]
MAPAEALLEWCRHTCAPYSNVEIQNLSTSFRDGLAFCAIIHKHRPDLIDFSSLTKDNVYHNNKLAFEVAEMKLGIPSLLDPEDMVSSTVPDSLSIITYLSQYHHYFSRRSNAGCASMMSSHVTILSTFSKSKAQDSLKPLKSLTVPQSGGQQLSSRTPHTVCNLCFRPVHLIQRRLIDGKVFHRSCFRCKVCRSTLLSGSYIQGHDPATLICTHHLIRVQSDLSQQILANTPKCTFEGGYLSVGGLAITGAPQYIEKKESQDRLIDKKMETEQREGTEDTSVGLEDVVTPAPPHPLPQQIEDTARKEAGATGATHEGSKTEEPSEPSSRCVGVTGGCCRPVPAPRRIAVPVPAPRKKTLHTAGSCHAAGNSSSQSESVSSRTSSPISPRVRTNHPWLTIIHPGPWTQLPPAPVPVLHPLSQSKSVSNLRGSWYRPRVPPPNPFSEELDKDIQKDTGKPEPDTKDTGLIGSSDFDEEGYTGRSPSGSSDVAQSPILPRSLSVPAMTSSCSHALSVTSSSKGKQVCKESSFHRTSAMPKSETFQALPSRRTPAPGHGFPLIKRKVQADQHVSKEDLQVETGELDKQLEALEQRGIQLEINLRDCKNDKEEQQMLIDWLHLFRERDHLVYRDTELVYLKTQQKLEERQADVEYELRCLLNKPESRWSQEDRGREQHLMDELVAIIDQRNQIVSSLDQDQQREREEDMHLESMMKNIELQKGLKVLKKSKGKFKPTNVLRMLNHKAEGTKDPMDSKS